MVGTVWLFSKWDFETLVLYESMHLFYQKRKGKKKDESLDLNIANLKLISKQNKFLKLLLQLSSEKVNKNTICWLLKFRRGLIGIKLKNQNCEVTLVIESQVWPKLVVGLNFASWIYLLESVGLWFQKLFMFFLHKSYPSFFGCVIFQTP